MTSSRRIRLQISLALAFSLLTGADVFALQFCFAQSKQNVEFLSQTTLHISAIEFDLGIEEANDVACRATRLKCGDVFRRDVIWRDLRSVFAALSTHWKTREAHTDWSGSLCAYPTATEGDGVRLTIRVAPHYKSFTGSNPLALNPIFDRSESGEAKPKPTPKPTPCASWNQAEKKLESDDSNWHLGDTQKKREKQLHDFLEEKSHRYPGYDSETNF